MKYTRPATVPAVGNFSRAAAGVFQSARWLDKPLPVTPTVPRLLVPLETRFGAFSGKERR